MDKTQIKLAFATWRKLKIHDDQVLFYDTSASIMATVDLSANVVHLQRICYYDQTLPLTADIVTQIAALTWEPKPPPDATGALWGR